MTCLKWIHRNSLKYLP